MNSIILACNMLYIPATEIHLISRTERATPAACEATADIFRIGHVEILSDFAACVGCF
jgi:hypothetical protein